jgi:hypothetical protein
MTDRRSEQRRGADRRDLKRPSLRLNLFLLLFAAVTLLFARHQRRRIDADFARVFDRSSASPSELNQIAAELAETDLAHETLEKELKSRLSYIESLQSQDYYLSIDTGRKTISLKSGNETVREASVRIGAPLAVKGPRKRVRPLAAALTGAFTVVGKKAPSVPPAANGQGPYVIFLPEDRVIRSPSTHDDPSKGPKPGSFVVSQADLQAIWDKITPDTRVYIF